MQELKFVVDEQNVHERIDKFLASAVADLSRSYLHTLIEDNYVSVNGKNVSKNYKLALNDEITLNMPEPTCLDLTPENIKLDIIYEDDDVLIVNKPKNMVVHPAAGNYSGTLVNALLYYCGQSLSGINGVARPGIVHRIDKDTSGLLIVAKNDHAHKLVAQQIKNHDFKREYEAIVYGNLKDQNGTICKNIARHKVQRKKMSVTTVGGKVAITHYSVISNYRDFTHVKLVLETGRTHQIRVHMASIGHAVLGDEVYASAQRNPFPFLKGQCLHARTLGFVHPSTGQYMEFTSPLPEYFQSVLNCLN